MTHFTVIAKGETRRDVPQDRLEAVCAELTTAFGPEGLRVVPQNGTPAVAVPRGLPAVATALAPVAPAAPVGVVGLDEQARLRILVGEAMAKANGFSPRQPLYAIGTRVNELGVRNARRSRIKHESKPTTQESCEGLASAVVAEQRRDRSVLLRDVTYLENGAVRVNNGTAEHEIPITEQAFGQLTQRIGCGGADYLGRCWPALRAHNVNEWLETLRENEARERGEWADTMRQGGVRAVALSKPPEPQSIVMRVRNHPEVGRECFAIVSDKYTGEFGIDEIAKAVHDAVPADARGAAEYDGRRVRIEAVWHSNVDAGEYAAGEFFKSGVVVRSDDTGRGGISVSAVVWRNLCLNLIIIDRAEQKVINLRHMGSLAALEVAFRNGFAEALDKVADFRKAWSYAAQDDVILQVQQAYPEARALTVSQVIPGIFGALIEREKIPVRARKAEAVPKLMQLFAEDEVDRERGFTRAAVVNAFTHYAHTEIDDPWQTHELEQAASGLLFPAKGRKTLDALPWQPLTI